MSNRAEESKAGLEIVVLYCQQGIVEEAKASDWSQDGEGVSVRAVMTPCSSKIEVPYILKLLESGVDGVEVVACPEKSCKLLTGSLRAEKRIDYIRSLLGQIGLRGERVGISRKLGQSPDKLMKIAHARADAVRAGGDDPIDTGE